MLLVNRLRWVIVAVLVGAACSSCSGEGSTSTDGAASSSAPATTSTAPVDVETTTSSATGTSVDQAQDLLDRRYFGFVLSMTEGDDGHWLEVEQAEMFSGDEALREAQRDGIPELGGPHYIRRHEGQIWTLWIDPSVVPHAVVDSAAPSPVSWDEFAVAYGPNPPRELVPYPIYVTISGGRVVAVEQQYLP